MVFYIYFYKCVCKLFFDVDMEFCMKLCLIESIVFFFCDYKEMFFVFVIDIIYFYMVDCKGLGMGDCIVEFFCIVCGIFCF